MRPKDIIAVAACVAFLATGACASTPKLSPEDDAEKSATLLVGLRDTPSITAYDIETGKVFDVIAEYADVASWFVDSDDQGHLFSVAPGVLEAHRLDALSGTSHKIAVGDTPGNGTSIDYVNSASLVLTSHFKSHKLTARHFDGRAFGEPQEFDCQHAHQFLAHPSEEWAYATCRRGQLIAFRVDSEARRVELIAGGRRELTGGPRHMAFHPNGMRLYVLLESSSEIAVYTIDQETGLLSEQPTQRLASTNHGERNTSSDVHLTPDGKWLYAFNRKDESMGRFAVAEDGSLTFLGVTEMDRGAARRWAMAPDGSHVMVATLTGNLSRWDINPDTGDLTFVSDIENIGEANWAGYLDLPMSR